MHIINRAVSEIESMIEDCGISQNAVVLEPDKTIPPCAYESGPLMKITFGDRSGEFSGEVTRATTKPSFMFGASLNTPGKRAAAAGIINAVSGFLCISRKLHSCDPSEHLPCQEALSRMISGRKICCIGEMPEIKRAFRENLVEIWEDADLLLVTGDGLIGEEGASLPDPLPENLLFIGPSTAGAAGILHGEHFCPYGRPNL